MKRHILMPFILAFAFIACGSETVTPADDDDQNDFVDDDDNNDDVNPPDSGDDGRCRSDFECPGGQTCKDGFCVSITPGDDDDNDDNDSGNDDDNDDTSDDDDMTDDDDDNDDDATDDDDNNDTSDDDDDVSGNCQGDFDCIAKPGKSKCEVNSGKCVECLTDIDCTGSLTCVSFECKDAGASDDDDNDDTTDDDDDTTGDCNPPCGGTKPYCVDGVCYSCLSRGCGYGEFCNTQSGYCEKAKVCKKEADCPADKVCRIVSPPDDKNKEPYIGCDAPVGSALNGEACSGDGDCRSRVCFKNKCTGPCEAHINCSDPSICSYLTFSGVGFPDFDVPMCLDPPPYCKKNSDCQAGEACTPFITVEDIKAVCYNSIGSKEGGMVCSNDNECKSGYCINKQFCFEACEGTADCSDVPGSDCLINLTLTGPEGQEGLFKACTAGN